MAGRPGRGVLAVVAVLLAATAGCAASWGGPTDSAQEPEPEAGLLWVGDAETGDLSQYQAGEWNDVGGVMPTVVTSPIRGGRFAIRLSLTGATNPGDGICCGTRNELVPRFRDLAEGDDLYFAFSTYLAPGFSTSGGWQLITQFKQNFDGAPPLSLNVEDGQYQVEGGAGHPDGPKPFALPIGAASTDRWVDWVLHVRFSTDPLVGFVEVWRDGELVLPRFAPESGTLYPGTGDRAGSYVKTGPYRNPKIVTPATMYIDDWRIGTTWEAVQND
jgi:hypothetical protein